MDKSNTAPIPARRPWYRLHLSTWLTLPLGLIVAVLVVVPGGVGRYPERPSWDTGASELAVVHGWPLPFLWRTPKGWNGDPAKVSPTLPWRVTDSVRELRLLPLVADVAFAGTAVLLFVALVEGRRRRRVRAVQFTLLELLIAVPLAAIALGWWGQQRSASLDVEERLSRLGGQHLIPRLPLWLRTAFGDDALSRLGVDGPAGTLGLSWSQSHRQDIQYIVAQFPHESIVRVDNPVSSDDMDGIACIDRLEEIECCYRSAAELTLLFTRLERHPRLRYIRLVGGGELIDDTHLSLIASLPQLESLTIVQGADKLTAEGFAELRKCTNLKELEIDCARLTGQSLACIGDIRGLRRLDLTGAQLIKADLSSLRRLDGLKEVIFWGTNVDDDDARQLRTLPSLRRLTVHGTEITKAGAKQLLDPSAEFAAHNLEQITLDADLIDDDVIATFKNLPRLHLITVTWGDDDWGANGNSRNYQQLISDLKKALPDRDVVSEQMIGWRT